MNLLKKCFKDFIMLKSIINRINIKKLIVFFVLEIFLVSLFNLNANEINNIIKEEIILNYKYDKQNDLLKLTWEDDKSNYKYYVFRKSINESDYNLVSGENGLEENVFITSLRDNIGSYFIVCKKNKINELPDNIQIFSLDGNEKDIALSYKSLRDADGLESNVIQIIPNENIENIYVKKEDNTKWTDKDFNRENKKKVVLNNNVTTKLQKVKKEIINAVLNDINQDGINDKNNEKIDGLYWINNGSDTVIEYKHVKLEIPSGSTPEDSYIYIKPLNNNEIITTPFGSSNLTSGSIKGYDISLNGDSESRFLKDIKISFKYDAEKIPQYTNKNNVFTYYFDEEKGTWQTLKRESVKNNYITSTTNHFCQFYTGTMDIQNEPPQAKGINTDPVNIQKVDPMAGIWGLPEINPNNRGSAEFGYKFEIPEGINGLTPGIGLSYSSEMKDGNAGYGWNYNTSSIEIKIKNKGVPKYNGNETLMLDGKELVKTGDNEYRFKVEGTFSRVVKNTNNSFTIFQTDGTVLTYGIDNDYRQSDPDNNSRIFRWYLSKIEDKFGNEVEYIYELSSGKNLFLSQINYAFIAGSPRYKAVMTWQNRTDQRESYIAGFKTVNDKNLDKIDIYFENELTPLKTYDLEYITGAFGKNMLGSIKEIIEGNVINHQSFEYDKDVNYSSVFSNYKTWNTEDAYDKDTDEYAGPDGTFTHERLYIDLNGDGISEVVKPYVGQMTYSGESKLAGLRISHNTSLENQKYDERKYYGKLYDNPEYDPQYSMDYWFFLPVLNECVKDYNGDGLPDFYTIIKEVPLPVGSTVFASPPESTYITYLNTGNGFIAGRSGHVKDTVCNRINLPSSDEPDIDFWIDYSSILDKIDSVDGRVFKLGDIEAAYNIDINGDGLPDKTFTGRAFNEGNVPAYMLSSYPTVTKVFIKNGTNYNNPYTLEYDLTKINEDAIDINGDGLVDMKVIEERLIPGSNGSFEKRWSFDINDGKEFIRTDGFHNNNDWEGGEDAFSKKSFMDVNSDGLPDFIYMETNVNSSNTIIDIKVKVGINNGFDFENAVLVFEKTIDSDNRFNGFADIDGDGYLDLNTTHNGKQKVYLNKLSQKNNIQKITNVITGVSTVISFDRSYTDPDRSTNKNYMNKHVLKSITTGKENVQQYTTTFDYESGVFDRTEHEFRGFEKVKVSVQDKTTTNVFHESETIYNVKNTTGEKDTYGINDKYDQYEKSNILSVSKSLRVTGDTTDDVTPLGKTEYEYEKINVFGSSTEHDKEDVKLIHPVRTKTWIYDYEGNFIGSDVENGDVVKESSLTVDNTSGVITRSRTVSYGDPHNTKDDIIETVDYAVNTSGSTWLCLPSQQSSEDITNQPISKKILYYDGQTKGSVSAGVLTSEKICDVKTADETDFSHRTTTLGYDTFGNVTYTKDPAGTEATVTVTYNDDTHATIVTKTSMDLSETSRYDKYGRLTESEDIYDDVSSYNYDTMGRVTSIVETVQGAPVTTKEFVYEKNDTHYKVTASYMDEENTDNKLSLVFFKDAIGREVQSKAEGYVEGEIKNIVSGKIEYDEMGRVQKTGPVSTTLSTDTNYEEKIITATDPVTTSSYDKLGRIEETILPSGLRIETRYKKEKITDTDSEGNTIVRILGVTTTASYDGTIKKSETIEYKDLNGAVVKTEKWKEGSDYSVIELEYNLFGHGKVIEKEGIETKIGEKQLDSLGRLQWMKSPDGGKIEYEYNDKGLVTKVTDYGKNESDTIKREINYIYDTKNRITEINYTGDDGSNTVTYEYYPETDSNTYRRGCVKTITKGTYYSVNYEYGQLWIEEAKTINGSTYTSKYEYDVQGRIKNLTYPDGEVVTYSYDEGGFLKHVEGVKNSVTTVYIDEIRYNKEGQKTYTKYGNGTEMTYTYDDETLLLDNYIVKKDANELLNYTYTFDIIGNITAITDAPNTITKSEQNYTYDIRSRLTSAAGTYNLDTSKNYSRNFTYSDDNRILEKTFGNDNAIYTFNYAENNHAVTSVNIQKGTDAGLINFTYDDFGNMTSRTYTGLNETESQIYTYDISNKMKSVVYNGTTTEFMYDNKGQRIKKTYEDNVGVISETTYITGFYTDKDGMIVKSVSDGKYVVASKILNDSASIKFYHQNHIGSTALLTDNVGEKFQSYLYMPYGETWVVENGLNAINDANGDGIADDVNHLFTGQEYDKETGLYYYNARYYDPHLGMFMRPDPAMDGLNHYAYANCNPVMYNDPTGMYAGVSGSIGGSMGGAYGGVGPGTQGNAAMCGMSGPGGNMGGYGGIGGGYSTMTFDQSVQHTQANYYLHGIYNEAQWNIYKQRRKADFVKVYDWGKKYGKRYVWGEHKTEGSATHPSESDVTDVIVDNNDDGPYNPEPQYQPWLSPIRGDAYVSSDYGWRDHPFRPGARQWHPGFDTIPNGVSRPQRIGWDIIAPQGGTTSRMSWDNIYGWNIYLRFMYEGDRYQLRFSHLRRFLMRRRGLHLPRIVRRGDVIGAMGSSGDSTGPHLDMEIKIYNPNTDAYDIEESPHRFYDYDGVGSVF